MAWKSYNPEQAAARFDCAKDFTVGIEEEFQILDPESLALADRFEELQEKARRRIGESVRGELIASEIEICTGICGSMDEAGQDLRAKRRAVFESAAELGMLLGATGTHPFADWKEQRIIDTPHYRAIDRQLRYCAWRNVTFGMHVHIGIRGRERMIAVFNAMRRHLPALLALSANSPFAEDRYTYLHSTRTQLFTRWFPRCGIPCQIDNWDGYTELVDTLFTTGSISEPTQIWWSVRPHPVMATLETRICDCQSSVEDTLAIASLIMAVVARLAADYDEGGLQPAANANEIEENLWRAIRHGLDGNLVDFEAKKEVPAREAVRRLIEYSALQQRQLGLAKYINRVNFILENGNGAQRQIRAYNESGEFSLLSLSEIARSQLEVKQAADFPCGEGCA
ncbi:MAG: YbdK family carboxylate-amine ligase [Actinobacteria bacterium]|nr:YbdK family carboxylate-amine ligase [Actinomycetota bacterium]